MYLSKITLTLHSNDAELLFKGGEKTKQFIPGFFFAQKRLNAIFAMSMKDNPYAETALIEIDLRLEEVEQFIAKAIEKSEAALEQAKQDGMTVALLKKDVPTNYDIDYATEYSNLLARMMLRADLGFRYLRSAHSSGYLDTEIATEFIKGIRRNVRMVFDRASTYAKKIQPGITREDLLKKTDKGKSMIEKLGMPNEKILSGEMTFKHKRITELGL